MKKHREWNSHIWLLKKLLRIMKLTSILILVFVISVNASSYSQTTKLSITVKNGTFVDVLKQIENQSEYYFYYNNDEISKLKDVSISISNKKIEEVLEELLSGTNLEYKIIDRYIALKKKEGASNDQEIQQQKPVSGKVTDSSGISLPGVSIVVKGTTNGVIAGNDGSYSISNVPANATLQFSFVGMKTQEVVVGDKTTINVTLAEETVGIEEVIAIGYGTQRKRDLTGSVVSVNSDQIASLSVPSISDALQGRAAGVQIISSGVPGSDARIRIRGVGTINNNNPLLVIDGVPTDEGLNQLNMSDIESIQVLKDASSAAIYGSRGANGVVIVTTKTGKANKNKIDFNCFTGIQDVTSQLQMLNASEFAALHNEMMENAGLLKNPAYANPETLGKGTDWVGAVFSPAATQNYSISYSGGNEKSTYYVSGNVFDQKGVVEATGFKRYTVKFNSETKIFDRLKFGTLINFNHDNKYSGDYNIRNTFAALPTQAIYNEDGTYAGPQQRPSWDGDIVNPLGRARLVKSTTLGYNLLGSVYSEIQILEGLKFKSSAGLKASFWNDRTWSPKYNWTPNPQDNSYLYQQSNKSITWNWDNTLTYNKIFNKVHNLTVMAGTSAQANRYEYMNGSIQNFASDLTQQLSNGIDQVTLNGNASEWALMSYMGRLNYAYNDKYLVTLTLRRDGSSRFGSANKWGMFPSGSVAWRISEEDFFKQFDFIDNLKLRTGYGVTGNQEIGNYSFASVLQTIKYNFNDHVVNSVVPLMMPNPNVKWESQKQTNVGFDAAFLNQRVNLTVDAYYKNTENMLVPMSVPISTGYSDIAVPFINAGKIQNKGIELSLTTQNIKGEFNWNTDFNISFNRNKVMSLNDTIPLLRGNVGFNYSIARIEVGHPVDIFYGFVTDGVFQSQAEVDAHAVQVPGNDPYNRTSAGDIRFKDLNSDGIIDDKDRTYIGNPNPDFYFSLNNTFDYKGFDLSIFLQGVYGNDIFNANRIWTEGMAVAYNQSTETLNRWTGAGTSNSIPRAIFNDPNKNTRPSDRYIEDGSYVRVKNVSLGYTIPKRIFEKFNISSARFYLSGTNLFTLTKYKGFSPELGENGASGIDNATYPVTRVFSIGANISF